MSCCCKDKTDNIYDPSSDSDNSSTVSRKRSVSFRSESGLDSILVDNEHQTAVKKQGLRVHSNDGMNSYAAKNDLLIVYEDDNYHHNRENKHHDHHNEEKDNSHVVHNPIAHHPQNNPSIASHIPSHTSHHTVSHVSHYIGHCEGHDGGHF